MLGAIFDQGDIFDKRSTLCVTLPMGAMNVRWL